MITGEPIPVTKHEGDPVIGATLNTSISRYEYSTTAAIILLIVALVFGLELLSGVIRARLR